MKALSVLRTIAILAVLPSAFLRAQSRAAHGADARAEEILKKMTLEEKLGQLSQLFWDKSLKDDRVKNGTLGSYLFLTDAKEINRLQHISVEQTRLHIPLLIGFDVIHGFRTTFPVPLATAASWDLDLNEQVQAAAADEAWSTGINWAFSPMVDIARDARWGRIVEGAGEDPFLGSSMAAARVRGFQGPRNADGIYAPHHILACAKHFAGYGAGEGGRDYDSVYLSDTQLENVYFPPFKAALDAGAGCIMSGYIDVNDVPASGNRYLLHDVLRDRWNFKGFVVSDAWAVYNLVGHGFAKDHTDAAARGLHAGVDMDMGSDSYFTHGAELLKDGRLKQAEIDDAVRRILRTKFELGLFDHPYVDESAAAAASHNAEHIALARRAAEESAVLLRNEGNLLPLAGNAKSIAVIGPLANAKEDLLGSWSFSANPEQTVTVVEALRKSLPQATIRYAPGAAIERKEEPLLNRDHPLVADPKGDALLAEALKSAQSADTIVMVLGEVPKMSGEYASRSSLMLAGRQQELLEKVVAVGKPVILVLISGRPVDLTWASTHVPSILQAWFPGQEGGAAIANLLLGGANPSGKLPVTWPRSSGQEPLYYNHNLTQVHEDDPNFASYYWDTPQFPLYRFGFGLSYTTFRMEKLSVSAPAMSAAGLDVSVNVVNTGTREGVDVVQLYTHQRYGSASRPVRELKGFERVALKAGETRTVTLHLTPDALRFWSPATRAWSTEAAAYDVWVGDSSAADLHGEFTVPEHLPVERNAQGGLRRGF